jgi:hypothetical protein
VVVGFEHALRRPPGLVSLVAADSPASVPDFVTERNVSSFDAGALFVMVND